MKLVVNKAAVLGAGVMGAQIAAHLANANVPVVLFDLPAKEGDKNGIVKKALDGLKRLQPSPLVTRDKLQYIDAANYEEHLELLSGCDLIIEAIAERMDWKNDLYGKKSYPTFWRRPPQLPPTPPGCRSMRWPRRLPEPAPEFLRHPLLQPAALHAAGRNHRHPHTDPATLDGLETWLTSRLGKGVVRALRYAQLRRQPSRRLLVPGRDAHTRAPSAWVRIRSTA
jgi:3-hydroxyacyl-CoA dehydrogenase